MKDGARSPRFGVSLLGGFQLTGPDGTVDLSSDKLAALLTYLACTAPHPQQREKLSALLWGSYFDAQAKQNLRQALYRLRKVLGQDALQSDGEMVSLNTAVVLSDVSQFEGLVCESSHDALRDAAELYRGQLADGIAVGEEGWNEWLASERERLLELALGAVMRLGEQELAAGRPEHALKAAQRAIALNNMREDAHRLIIRSLATTGRRAEALRHYQHLVALLKRELNTEPDAATNSLVDELRRAQSSKRSPSVEKTAQSALPQVDERSIALPLIADTSCMEGALADKHSVQGDAASPALPGAPDRRQLTVMVCAMASTKPFPEDSDPEEMSDRITTFHKVVANVARRFGGFVALYLGGCVHVYFGYPEAHEHDAEKAVRAGLALVDSGGTPETASGAILQPRVGIATGLVVVRDQPGTGEQQLAIAVGETPNLAVQLQTMTAPGEVAIAAGTWRLVGRMFDCHPMAGSDLKGLPPSVKAWHVRGETVGVSRFDARRAGALLPLVGRQDEIELLMRRWDQAKLGEGRIVLLSGEPGIGKSRIAEALLGKLADEPHACLRYFCSPHSQDSPLFPFVDQLSRAAGFERGDSSADKLEKLETLLAGTSPDDDIALLADLLSLPSPQHRQVPNFSPQRKKERTLEALIRQLSGLACRQPVVIVFEDAHWIDPTSRDLLDLTVERVRNLPVLLLVTHRPEFHPDWIGQSQVTTLTLNRLDRHDRIVMVEQIASGKALPDEVVALIIDTSDGVPLFVEEVTKSIIESGVLHEERDRYVLDRLMPMLEVPTSLHSSLLARLDRLGPARVVAQIGAAIGRQFSYTLLLAVSRLPEDELEVALNRLVASGLVFQRGIPPYAIYSFKHALVREAAHGSLLRTARRQFHKRIAEALLDHSPELLESRPELFAQHYAEAGLAQKSAALWCKAGRRAAARSAMAEAAAHFDNGLDQLALLPDTPERQLQELEIRSSQGAVLFVARGHAAPETGQAYARARELWEQVGSPSEFIQIPYGESRHHVFVGDLDFAHRLDADLLNLSRKRNHSAGQILGHYSSGRNLMLAGRFDLSRTHLEKVPAIFDENLHRSLVLQAGDDPHINSHAVLGLVLFCLGYPEQALAQSSKAIGRARRLAHVPSLVSSLGYGNRLLTLMGNDGLSVQAEELFAVTTEQGFPFFRAQGMIDRGWNKVKKGDVAAGVSLLRSGSAAYRVTGALAWVPYHTALLAIACGIAGEVKEALTLLDDALELSGKRGERWLDAELNRQKGALLLRQGHIAAAEENYRKAHTIAREQNAKLWELRAATNLAGLYRDQRRRAEAHEVLASTYNWFTEGFETADLREAKALLEELR